MVTWYERSKRIKELSPGFRFPIKHSDWKYIFHEQFFTTHNMCLWKPPQSVQYWRRRTSIWQDSRQNLTRNIFPTTTNNGERKNIQQNHHKLPALNSCLSELFSFEQWTRHIWPSVSLVQTFLIWTVKKTSIKKLWPSVSLARGSSPQATFSLWRENTKCRVGKDIVHFDSF